MVAVPVAYIATVVDLTTTRPDRALAMGCADGRASLRGCFALPGYGRMGLTEPEWGEPSWLVSTEALALP